ncbi:MAG TPA: ATP-dependent 6-phosphofructokinase [Candidatus Binatia bacterium]|nr:ATP-dependent 6-phosphofructokinase [Candidatus Binatia bacterium]
MTGSPTPAELAVPTLGPCRRPAPAAPFVDEADRVLLASSLGGLEPFVRSGLPPPSFEPAGPRARLFFAPRRLTCGIVTCGGLCPGLNNVIRALVLELHYGYGVRRVLGFRYGYAGLSARAGHAPLVLTPAVVDALHEHGGTLLGASRGPQDVREMVDTLERCRVGILFVCGGDGGLRGAAAIAAEIARRRRAIAVVGIPKTIDNDLGWTWRSFGFATAVEAARAVVQAAHVEARAAWNGVGLVKLMGRHAGFIAAAATLASSDVNFCLVPEVPFGLEGRGGLLDALERRLEAKRHAVIVVAEGAGQEHARRPGPLTYDASGNVRLADVGVFLRDRIVAHFARRRTPVTVRYLDPSYAIRSLPAGATDARYCLVLGQHAVHAGMAGRTNVVIGWWNQRFVHVPIPLAVRAPRRLDPAGEEWQRVLEATGQPGTLLGAGPLPRPRRRRRARTPGG